MQTDISFTNDVREVLSFLDDDQEMRTTMSTDPLIAICLTEDNAELITTPSLTMPTFALADGKLVGFIDVNDLHAQLQNVESEVFQRENYESSDSPDTSDVKPILYCVSKSKEAILKWLADKNIEDPTTIFYIQSLGVRQSCRGRKIGTKLAEQQLVVLRGLGATHAFVETTGNASRKIFQKLGFQEINFVNYKQMTADLKCKPIEDHDGFATLVITL